MALVNFRKKLILFFGFLLEFGCSDISAVTEHTRNQFFLVSYQKKFLLKNVHFRPIR
jgi:hypothetical protein